MAKPKFKVGQVVMIKSTRKDQPFKIQAATWYPDSVGGEWFYSYNSRNACAEHMLRPLTDEEKG